MSFSETQRRYSTTKRELRQSDTDHEPLVCMYNRAAHGSHTLKTQFDYHNIILFQNNLPGRLF